jgi:hypothetical protein
VDVFQIEITRLFEKEDIMTRLFLRRYVYSFGLAAILLTMIGCEPKKDQHEPRGTHVIYAGPGFSKEIGAYAGVGFFQVNLPEGDYRLTYTTNLDTYNLIFRVSPGISLVNVGLTPGESVAEASLLVGTISDSAFQAQATETNRTIGSVTLMFWPAMSNPPPLSDVFTPKADGTPVNIMTQGTARLSIMPACPTCASCPASTLAPTCPSCPPPTL